MRNTLLTKAPYCSSQFLILKNLGVPFKQAARMLLMNSRQMKRRNIIFALGSTGALIAVGCASSSSSEGASSSGGAGSGGEAGSPFDSSATCVLTPEVTDGPYYIDGSMDRKDLREGREGAQLTLRMRVVDVKDCQPIPGAVFDVWNCDAGGTYSGYESGVSAGQMIGGGGPGGGPDAGMIGAGGAGADLDGGMPPVGNIHVEPTDATRYLRGTQVADENGTVEFITIYPGWYDIRTHHVHFKVFVSKTELVTGQIYFPQKLNDEISLSEPYSAHSGTRTTNTDDALIKSDNDPAGTWPTMTMEGSVYVATVTIAVQR
jgi:protocatechuate 3,4-dioxygenase beta subunit